jgi:hypothetical protein
MIASCAWMLMTPHAAVPEPPRPSQPSAGQAGLTGQPGPAWPAFGQDAPESRTIAAPAQEGGEPAGGVTPGPGAPGTPGAAAAHSGPGPDTAGPAT